MEINYRDIAITFTARVFGCEYEFSHDGKLYFAHYPDYDMAKAGAESRVDEVLEIAAWSRDGE